MGVTGLWRLIEPAGKPVPVETLENKILAVDISIWLHQVVKGYQDARGAPLPNAHLIGLFQRLCKLLYFRIKPVFVFDGGFPELKKETIAKRHDNKAKYNSESERLKREVLLLLSKKTAISNILGKETSPKKTSRSNSLQNSHDDDIFKLPLLPPQEDNNSTESESEDETSSGSIVDLHSVDIESENFKCMPVKEKYELLLELKDTRKMNSWGKLNELPKKSDNFSDFQMQRLLKRRKLQECLEETEKEMGDGCMSLNEIESLLNADGINTQIEKIPTRRIASSDTTRILFIKDVKQALEDAKNKQKDKLNNDIETNNIPSTSKQNNNNETIVNNTMVDELDEDLKKAIQMSLECEDEPNSSSFVTESNTSKSSRSGSLDSSFMLDSDHSESDSDIELPDMSSAKAYIMQYSDFTYKAIDEIVKNTKINKNKAHSDNLDKILKELNEEKSIIMAKIDLSSDEDKVSNSNNINSNNQTSDLSNVSHATPNVKLKKEDCSIITLNSSLDDAYVHEHEPKHNDSFKSNFTEESDSSDNDFEEVLDEIKHCDKPTVQLNLKLDEVIEDDIFADVFSKVSKDDSANKIQKENTIEQTIRDLDNNEGCKNKEITENVSSIVKEPPLKCDNYDISKLSVKTPVIKELMPTQEQNLCHHVNNDTNEFQKTCAKQDVLLLTKEQNLRGNALKYIPDKLTEEKLQSISDAIEIEENNLCKEKARLDRIGRNITEEMTKEVQELLQVFGIPYIVAPMEAEAQCAFLEKIKLTDGTITDDSDIWLFGGHTVYKNFFNQKKHVLQFLSERINRSFNLNREKLVLLALLVGSDYTTGVTGIGPVTAMEILASFPYNKREISDDIPRHLRYSRLIGGLQDFKKWVRSGKRTDNTILKKKLKNIDVADDFPSSRVVEAYFEPNVDKCRDTFTWGKLDITVLRDYAKAKFGWSQSKLDEIINPVIKRLNDRKNQKTIQSYFKRKTDFESLEDQMSKRVKAAVQKMDPAAIEQEDESGIRKKSKPIKIAKKKIIPSERKKKDNVQSKNIKIVDLKNNLSETTTKSLQLLNKIPTVRVCDGEISSNKFDIKVPKFNHSQEIIPQREKDRQSVLQNKMKAIEIFRKSKIDKKHVKTKKKVIQPKDDAGLSESDSD